MLDSVKLKIKKLITVGIFLAVVVILFIIFNFIAQPVWRSSGNNNYETTHGFYKEPKNTIETVFIGSSHVRYAFSPMELYENYGICAYDFSTDSQPMLASYYWMEEAYRLNPETLDTVVLDVEMIKKNPAISYYHKALDNMQFSDVKLRAVRDYSDSFTDFLLNMIPLLSYHERWKELTAVDFKKYSYEPELSIRGYQYSISEWVGNVSDFSELSTPLRILDEDMKSGEFNDTAMSYFRKMVSFCEEHDINLVLIKTPTSWTSADHNAFQKLADEYGLDFIDFNIEPYYSEIEFILAEDVINPSDINNLHLNYYGAMKITDYLGTYLTEVCGNRDVRDDERYAFMDEELDDYHRYIASTSVKDFTDPCDYIDYALEQGDYSVFISVKGDGAVALTDDQRSYFDSIGLTGLSKLSEDESYLAVIEDGSVITEMSGSDSESSGGSDSSGSDGNSALEYEGTLPDGTVYSMVSGGTDSGNKSSIKIGGTERSSNSRGLNIVLYDNKREEYVGNAVFDTHSSPERDIQNVELRLAAELEEGATLAELSGTDRTLYLYNRMCDDDKIVKLLEQQVGEDGLVSYLMTFIDDEDLTIYLTVQNDAAGALSDEVRCALSDMGLTRLSEIAYNESYIAVIVGGEVVLEEKGETDSSVETGTSGYKIVSRIGDTDGKASVMINGTDYAEGSDGVCVVVYDNLTEMVIDVRTFDTGTVPQIAEGEAVR